MARATQTKHKKTKVTLKVKPKHKGSKRCPSCGKYM